MIDFDIFKKIYGLSENISQEEMSTFLGHAKRMQYRKSEILLQPGTKRNLSFIVVSGLVGKFKQSENGESKIFEIYYENHGVFNWELILDGEPSGFSFEAMEDTTVLEGDFDFFLNMILHRDTNYPSLNENIYFMLRNLLSKANKKIEQFLFLSPKERYEIFLKENPKVINRISDKHIASLLGMHPVTLSRIRRQMLHDERVKQQTSSNS